MSDFVTPLTPEYTIFLPEDIVTWLIYGAWFLLILVGMIALWDRKVSFDRRFLSWLAILSALVLVLTPFFGVMFFSDSLDQGNYVPIKHLMIFAAVPFMVGVGVLGAVPAALLAGISGVLLAYLDTHQITTPLLLITLSLIFSWTIRRRHSGIGARVIQFPVAGAIFAWLISTPIIFVSLMLSASGPIGLRFALAFDLFPPVFLSFGGMTLFGGLAATLIRVFFPEIWLRGQTNEKKAEKRFSSRLFVHLGLLFIVVFAILINSVWRMAENTARGILVEQMINSAGTTAEGLVLFINTGKSQIESLVENEVLATRDPNVLSESLSQVSKSQSYFDLLGVFSDEGKLIAAHSKLGTGEFLPTPEESLAVKQARNETSPMILVVPPMQQTQTAHVSFIVSMEDPQGQINRVLLGRTAFNENPIVTLFLESLENLESNGGMVQIIDEQGRRLYHSNPDLLMTDYANPRFATTTFWESKTMDNKPMMMFYQPSGQTGWDVITAFPVAVRNLMAWEFAKPLLSVGFSGFLILNLIVFVLVSPLARELNQLKAGIKDVLARNLPPGGVGGKGWKNEYEEDFTKTFDFLNRRVQQQRDLLRITGQNSHSPNLEQDLLPVMKAALAQGVSSIRIVLGLDKNKPSDSMRPDQFSLGRDTRLYAPLDQQIYSHVRSAGILTLRDFQIEEQLDLIEGMPYPASLIALPLKSSENWFGVLWVTFPENRDPGMEEVDFFSLLSERASDILAKHAVMEEFLSLQEKMVTALDELSQGILLADEEGKVVYHNPRLCEILNIPGRSLIGRDTATIFQDNHFSDLVKTIDKSPLEKEVRLPGGEVLSFRKQPVNVNGKPSGSAMIITPLRGFKTKLDSSSELVTLVSHALRSPLTLIHGYAKILRLTGNLNNQQDDYIIKIIKGIEEMRSLVQNLLDVGRLESLGVIDISAFPVSEVLSKLTDSMEAQFRQKNIKFSVSLPDEPLMIQADFTLLTQAIKNLVENALQFTKMGGEVSLKVWERDGRVIFAVKDTGAGISPLDQRHLFEKFQPGRGPGGDNASPSGLGLAIVRSIVEHHDGRVWVESQLGKGSTFFIEVPKQHG